MNKIITATECNRREKKAIEEEEREQKRYKDKIMGICAEVLKKRGLINDSKESSKEG